MFTGVILSFFYLLLFVLRGLGKVKMSSVSACVCACVCERERRRRRRSGGRPCVSERKRSQVPPPFSKVSERARVYLRAYGYFISNDGIHPRSTPLPPKKKEILNTHTSFYVFFPHQDLHLKIFLYFMI